VPRDTKRVTGRLPIRNPRGCHFVQVITVSCAKGAERRRLKVVEKRPKVRQVGPKKLFWCRVGERKGKRKRRHENNPKRAKGEGHSPFHCPEVGSRDNHFLDAKKKRLSEKGRKPPEALPASPIDPWSAAIEKDPKAKIS